MRMLYWGQTTYQVGQPSSILEKAVHCLNKNTLCDSSVVSERSLK